MIHTIIWMVYLVLYLLCVAPVSWYITHLRKRGETERARALTNRVVSRWARCILWMGGVRVTVRGKENLPRGNAVFTPNHQSDFDIPVMLTVIDRVAPLLAKEELKKVPGIRDWMRQIDCVFVDRTDEKQAARAIIACAKMVKEGHSMTIFPEGTRSKGGPVAEFKGGAFRVATRSGVPVVPITIDGTWHAFEERKRIRSTDVIVTIHPPIETKGMSRQEQAQLGDRVREQILTALPERYRGTGQVQ